VPSSASATAGGNAGYRLGGADVRPFLGQRVQIVGMFAPASAANRGATGTTGSATASTTGAAGSASNAMPEFRVISIQPIAGSCAPQQ